MTTRTVLEKHCLNDLAAAINAWGKRIKKEIKICISADAKTAVIFGNLSIQRTTRGNKSVWDIKHKNENSQPTEDQWLKSPEQFENMIVSGLGFGTQNDHDWLAIGRGRPPQ